MIRAADEVLAGFGHRLVVVEDDALGMAFAPAFADAGYEHGANLVMVFRGEAPAGPPVAEEVGLEAIMPVVRADWHEELPWVSDRAIDDLVRRLEARMLGADLVGFRAVRASGGEIAARAELYAQDGVAQIETLVTSVRHRGQGHARTLVTSMLAEAAGLADLIFLEADVDDWPKEFYGRLGFEPLCRTHSFLRME